MDLREIDENDVPEFKHDIDPQLYALLKPQDRPMAESNSIMRQELRWYGKHMLVAYNLSVQHDKWLKRYGPWVAALAFIAAIAAEKAIEAAVQKVVPQAVEQRAGNPEHSGK